MYGDAGRRVGRPRAGDQPRKGTRRTAARLAAAARLALLVLGLSPGLAAQEASATGALIASGDSPDLFLFYTGDVIGYLEPCG